MESDQARVERSVKSICYDRKKYSFECEPGLPLKFHHIGAITKKVLKLASRMWRVVNPPRNETIWPLSVLRCSYHARVLLRPCLQEKATANLP